MAGVDCHAPAEQRAASEILVSLLQFPTACVEASYHTGKCSERPVFMRFHFVCPPYARTMMAMFALSGKTVVCQCRNLFLKFMTRCIDVLER